MALLSTRGSAALRNYGWGISASGNTIGLFFGGYTATNQSPNNTVSRVNACLTLVGSQTSAGSSRRASAGSGNKVGCNAIMYGGFSGGLCSTATNTVTRINKCGTAVGCQTSVGTSRGFFGGATVCCTAIFYAGYVCSTRYNTVTRINKCGTIVGSETGVGTGRAAIGGAKVGSNGMYYGGFNGSILNTVTRINKCGAIVGSETGVGTSREGIGGADVCCAGIYYAGFNGGTYYAVADKINKCGALVGSEHSAQGTARGGLAGVRVGCNPIFFGGFAGGGSCTYYNTATKLNTCLALVSEVNVSGATARGEVAGAGM